MVFSRPILLAFFLALAVSACTMVPVSTATPAPAATSTPTAAPVNPTTPSAVEQHSALAVVFFDIGESGDGFLVSTPEGKSILIDGGRRGSGITRMLAALNVGRVDVMVATNPDADHIGGLIDVLKSIPVGEVWLSGEPHTTITFEDFIDAVDASKAQVYAVRKGHTASLGSVSIQVVNPAEPFFRGRNNNSVAIRLEYGKVSFLFTGDMESGAEQRLVESGVPLKSTVLKLGHHGSRTSTSESFLAAVQPEVAVYQAGVDNRYGHPHREVLARLLNAGVKVYGTGANGVIVIRTDGEKYGVETQR